MKRLKKTRGPSRRSETLLHVPELLTLTGLSLSTVRRLEAAGRFPRRRQLSPRRAGWLASEVAKWMRGCPVVHVRCKDVACTGEAS